jgi:hypothetical protein
MMKKVKINEDLHEGHTLYEYRGQTLDVGVVVPDCDGNSIAVIVKTPDGQRLSCDSNYFSFAE